MIFTALIVIGVPFTAYAGAVTGKDISAKSAIIRETKKRYTSCWHSSTEGENLSSLFNAAHLHLWV